MLSFLSQEISLGVASAHVGPPGLSDSEARFPRQSQCCERELILPPISCIRAGQEDRFHGGNRLLLERPVARHTESFVRPRMVSGSALRLLCPHRSACVHSSVAGQRVCVCVCVCVCACARVRVHVCSWAWMCPGVWPSFMACRPFSSLSPCWLKSHKGRTHQA